MKSFLLFLLLTCSILANAETITGVVVDENTNQPLPYATISSINGHFGIIADESGSFLLELKEVNEQDTFQVSYVGYHTIKRTSLELQQDGNCKLTAINFTINEVEIKPLNAEEILKQAYDKFYDNHVHANMATKGYYREQFFEGNECFRFGEAVFDTKFYQDEEKDLVAIVPYLARSVEDSTFLKKFNGIFNTRRELIPFGIDQYYENGVVEGFKVEKYHEYLGEFFFGKGKNGFSIKYQHVESHLLNGRDNYYVRFEVYKRRDHIANGYFLIDKENHGIAAFESKFIEQDDLTKRLLPARYRLLMRLFGYNAEIKGFNSKLYNRYIDGKWYIGNGLNILEGGIAKRGDWVRGKVITEFYTFYEEKVEEVEKKVEIKDVRTNDFNPTFWKNHPYIPIQPKQQEYIDQIIANNENFSGKVISKMVEIKRAKKAKKEAAEKE